MKTLKHFMLSEHTNQLYKEEAVSSISLTRDIAEKINELVDAYNELSETNLAKVQEQDGKIRKGILYMKDNLINTLHDLLEVLENDGFFENAVSKHTTELETRINNLLGSIKEGSTSLDAEVIDGRIAFDGTQFENIGLAIRTQIKDIVEELTSFYSRVFSKSVKLSKTGYIAEGDVINTTENAKRTGKIPCKDYEFVKFTTHISSVGYALALYNDSGLLIEEHSVFGDNTEMIDKIINISDANAHYMELSCYGEAYFNNFSCILYNTNHIDERIPTSFHEILSKDYELELDGYVALGNVINQNAAAKRTGKIPCKNYKFVKYSSYLTDAGYELALYDESGNFMAEHSILGSGYFVKDKIVDLSNIGACYLEVSCYGITNSKNAYCTLYNSDNREISTKHKQLLVFGDSITVTSSVSDDGSSYIEDTDTSWLTYARDIMQIGSYKNYATSGARYRDFDGEFLQNLSNQIKLATSDATNDNVDIIILSLGTNDPDITDESDTYENAMNVTSLSSLDKTKFYHAVRYAMWTLKKKYPKATCFVATPIQRASREIFPKIYNAILEMAKRYNFIVIDAYAECGIIRENEVSNSNGVYLKDGLHPNTDGDILMANYYSNVIMSRFKG